MDGGSVDVADAGLDASCQFQAAADVAGEQGRGQTVLRVVCEVDCFLGSVNFNDRSQRTEGFLGVDPGGLGDTPSAAKARRNSSRAGALFGQPWMVRSS
jgi:hypothetical protein